MPQLEWTRERRSVHEMSTWYQRQTLDGEYVVRRAISRLGLGTRIYALRRDHRGQLSVLLGSRFRSVNRAILACQRDLRTRRQLLPA